MSNPIIAKLKTLDTELLCLSLQGLVNDLSDEACMVYELALNELETRVTESEFVNMIERLEDMVVY